MQTKAQEMPAEDGLWPIGEKLVLCVSCFLCVLIFYFFYHLSFYSFLQFVVNDSKVEIPESVCIHITCIYSCICIFNSCGLFDVKI